MMTKEYLILQIYQTSSFSKARMILIECNIRPSQLLQLYFQQLSLVVLTFNSAQIGHISGRKALSLVKTALYVQSMYFEEQSPCVYIVLNKQSICFIAVLNQYRVLDTDLNIVQVYKIYTLTIKMKYPFISSSGPRAEHFCPATIVITTWNSPSCCTNWGILCRPG